LGLGSPRPWRRGGHPRADRGLLAHRQLPAEAVLAGIDAALKVGSTDPALVCIEARRIIDTPPCPVIPITQALQRYDRPAPTLGGYDTLLDATPTGAQP